MTHQAEKSYSDILDAFGEEKVKERFLFLLSKARDFIRHLERQEPRAAGCFTVSRATIEDLILDYFADIKRLKDFHDIERAQPFKKRHTLPTGRRDANQFSWSRIRPTKSCSIGRR